VWSINDVSKSMLAQPRAKTKSGRECVK